MTVETIDTPGSSHLLQVAWDDATSELEIAFADGAVYVYSSVPRATFEGFRRATSAGAYFHRQVKDRYAYRVK